MNTSKILNSLRGFSIASLGALALFASAQVFANTYQASSSKHPVALIELYTSQGCSSCPPAEKWLGELEKAGIDSNQAIPLALHVDYWDYIGWKDQFSLKYFTQRQYQYHRANYSESIYTPQIMFNGNDIRGLSFGSSLNELGKKSAAVAYTVNAKAHNDRNLQIAIDFSRINANAKNSNVIVVLAESNLIGNIKSGENAGKTLKHNHVVRVWKNMGKVRSSLTLNLPIDPEWNKENLDLVVIVETSDMQTQQALKVALH